MDFLKKLFLRKSSKYQPASTEDYEDKVSPLLQQPGDDVVKENINRNKYQKLTGRDESDDNSNYLLTYFPSRINNKDDMPLSEEQLNDFFKETRALRHEKIASYSEAEHDAIRALKIAIYSSAGYGANDKNNKPNMRSGIESASKELSEYVNDERLSQEMIQKIKNNLSKHIYSHLDLENVSVVVRNKIIQACKIATARIPQIAYSELIFEALSKLDKTFATEVKGIEYDCKSGCFSSEDGLVCHVFTDADELYLSFGGTTSKDNLGLATNGAQWKSNMLSIFNVTSNQKQAATLARAAVHAVDKSLKDDQVIYRQMQIVFCGHSKGGAEASRAQQEAMALMEQDLGISKAISISKATYNAAPDFIRKPVTNKQEDLNIQIRNKHDFVSAANPNSVTIDTETKNPIKAHSEYIKASLFHLIDVVCEKEMHQHFNNISSILENSIISRRENCNNNLSHRASRHTTGRPNMW